MLFSLHNSFREREIGIKTKGLKDFGAKDDKK